MTPGIIPVVFFDAVSDRPVTVTSVTSAEAGATFIVTKTTDPFRTRPGYFRCWIWDSELKVDSI